MAYIFMLGAMPLPIPPKSLDITSPSKNETVTLINDQEINIPKLEGLREISFDFLLPTFQKYPFETYRIGDYTAATFILYLKAWKASGIPLPFIVVRMSPSGKFLYFTSIMCVIEDYTYAEDAEEYGFDTNCSIKLKEYVFYSTKKVKYKDGQATTKKSRSTAERVKKSKVTQREGESGTSALKREGYRLNYDGPTYEVNDGMDPLYGKTTEPLIDPISDVDFSTLEGLPGSNDPLVTMDGEFVTTGMDQARMIDIQEGLFNDWYIEDVTSKLRGGKDLVLPTKGGQHMIPSDWTTADRFQHGIL